MNCNTTHYRANSSSVPGDPTDAEIIANYSNPAYVLDGWVPAMAPLILTPPSAITATVGQSVTFTAKVAAIPAPTYQWSKNGRPIPGAAGPSLQWTTVRKGDAGSYTVSAVNASGRATATAALTVR